VHTLRYRYVWCLISGFESGVPQQGSSSAVDIYILGGSITSLYPGQITASTRTDFLGCLSQRQLSTGGASGFPDAEATSLPTGRFRHG